MYIRKKWNKNGTCTILLVAGERVAGKKNPVTKTIKHFGTAKTKYRLKQLIKQAEEYKAHLEMVSPKPETLKITSDFDIKSCASFNTGFTDVYGKCFDAVFSGSVLKSNLVNKLRDLSIMRIAAPASKLKTTKLAVEYEIDLKVDNIYKYMDQLTAPIINGIKETIYNHTAKLLAEKKQTIDVLFYDLTTVYFETSTQDEVRNFGFSKDGKHHHVQIMLAVIVTKEGLPIDYEEFPGNCYEGHTLLPVLDKMQQKYNLDKVVLVADAALMNKINLQSLDDRNIKYVISARIKNTKRTTKESILDLVSYKTITKTTGDEIKAKLIPDGNNFIVAYHSAKRARKDAHDREKDLERIEKYIGSTGKNKLTTALKKSYVKISKDSGIKIDAAKLELQKQYDGYFGLYTNIENPDPTELLSLYRGLWQVEQTFRIAKTNLEIRPIFHYNPKRIRAHFVICYVALALVRYVEFILKYSGIHTPCEQLYLLLSRMRKIKITDYKDITFEFLEDPPTELAEIYKALKIKWPKKFSHHINL